MAQHDTRQWLPTSAVRFSADFRQNFHLAFGEMAITGEPEFPF
jgi:hypothetical protein